MKYYFRVIKMDEYNTIFDSSVKSKFAFLSFDIWQK